MEDIEKMTKELGEAIQRSSFYTDYRKAKENFDNNEEVQDLTGNFNLKKMNVVNEMQKENRDEARLKVMQDEMRAAYADLLRHPVMTEYMKRKEELETLVNGVLQTINFYVTGEDQGSCSGSCETCGGCH